MGGKYWTLFYSDFAAYPEARIKKSEISFEIDFVSISMKTHSALMERVLLSSQSLHPELKIKTDLPPSKMESKANRNIFRKKEIENGKK